MRSDLRVPVACTLGAPAAAERLGDWDRLLAAHVVDDQRPSPTRLILRLRDEPSGLLQAVDLARREVECCPFLAFAFQIRADGVTMSIEAPESAAMILDEFAASARDEPSPA